jgi:phosphoglycerol transferase MdoB-like AlkP superfamily enzyme
MQKIPKLFSYLINYRLSLKELYFSLTTWLLSLLLLLGLTTRFHSTLFAVNLVIALIVFLSIILLTNRLLLSGFLTLLLAVSFDYIKQIKWQFLHQDMSAADIFMVKLLINHGLFRMIYEYTTKEIYLVILLLLVNFILLWNRNDRMLDKSKLGLKNYYALRILSIGVAFLLLTKLFDSAIDKGSAFHRVINSARKQVKNLPKRVYGPFGDVLFTLNDIYISPISGKADESLILNLLSKTLDSKQIDKTQELPDIIVILNESTINPYKLDYPFVDSFNFNYFKDTQYTRYSGILDVNTFGGSSWISEYEINTGVPHKYFKGPSYMPFITLVPMTQNSIMLYLKSLGYETDIVYPIDKEFSMAREAYTQLGADHIYDIFDFGFDPKTWTGVPDRLIGDMIIKVLDQNPEKPKYIFAATMLNHGPHSSFFEDQLGCSQFMNEVLCSKLNDYITRLNQSNIDMLELINKLMSRKRKTILVNFGDHMPSFEGYSTQLRFSRDISNFYKTFYNINSNFLPVNKTVKYPVLDISLIPGLVLDMAGINQSEFYTANSLIRKNCNGNIKDCNLKENQNIFESYKSLVVKQLGF